MFSVSILHNQRQRIHWQESELTHAWTVSCASWIFQNHDKSHQDQSTLWLFKLLTSILIMSD